MGLSRWVVAGVVLVAAASVARADVRVRPVKLVVDCKIEYYHNAKRDCLVCASDRAHNDRCAQALSPYTFTRMCRQTGKVRQEVWCRKKADDQPAVPEDLVKILPDPVAPVPAPAVAPERKPTSDAGTSSPPARSSAAP